MSYHVYSLKNAQQILDLYHSPQHSISILPPLFSEKENLLIVQNRQLATWLKYALAEKHTVLTYDPKLPENSQRQLLEDFPTYHELKKKTEDSSKTLLFRDTLNVILYKKLSLWFHNKNYYPQLSELWQYLENASPQLLDNSLQQLAKTLSELFHHYGLNCLSLLNAWNKDILLATSSWDKQHEKWQKNLWQLLMKEDNYLLLGQVLQQLTQQKAAYEGPLKRITLIGSTFLGEVSLDFFYYLSSFCHIDHIILSPLDFPLAEDSIEFSLTKEWGPLSFGLRQHLKSYPDIIYHNQELLFLDEKPQLQFLQASFLSQPNREMPSGVHDSSLRLVNSSGIAREVDICKNTIVQWLNEDPTLSLSDIAITAASTQYESYLPFIEAVFTTEENGSQPLPSFDIHVLKKTKNQGHFQQAFFALLDLVGSRFTRSQVFHVFHNACFQEKQGIEKDTVDFWLELVEKLYIHWGYNDGHKVSLGLPSSAEQPQTDSTWQGGFSRLLALFDSENEALEETIYLDNHDSWEKSGLLIYWIETFYQELYRLDKQSRPLLQWIEALETLAEMWLSPVTLDDELDRRLLKMAFRNLTALLTDLNHLQEFENQNFNFSLFYSLLQEQINNSDGTLYQPQGITVGSLDLLRGIPKRCVYVLGMNEDFPNHERLADYDLREMVVRNISLSQENSHKQQFLELCLAVQEKLCLSYVGINAYKGSEQFPSVMLERLSQSLGYSYYDWCETHPLHAFSPQYFHTDFPWKNFNHSHFLQAQTLHQKKHRLGFPHSSFSFEKPEKEEWTIFEITNLCLNPIALVKEKLNLPTHFLDKSVSMRENDDESYELGHILPYSFSRKLFNPAHKEPLSVATYLEQQKKQIPLPKSDILHLKNLTLLREHEKKINDVKHGIPWKELKPLSLFIQENPPIIQRPYTYSMAPFTVKEMRIKGRLDNFYGYFSSSGLEIYFLKICSTTQEFSHYLEESLAVLWISLCQSSFIQEGNIVSIQSLHYTPKKNSNPIQRQWQLWTPEEAKQILDTLLTLLCEGELTPHFMPIVESFLISPKNTEKKLAQSQYAKSFFAAWQTFLTPSTDKHQQHQEKNLKPLREQARWIFHSSKEDPYTSDYGDSLHQLLTIFHKLLTQKA